MLLKKTKKELINEISRAYDTIGQLRETLKCSDIAVSMLAYGLEDSRRETETARAAGKLIENRAERAERTEAELTKKLINLEKELYLMKKDASYQICENTELKETVKQLKENLEKAADQHLDMTQQRDMARAEAEALTNQVAELELDLRAYRRESGYLRKLCRYNNLEEAAEAKEIVNDMEIELAQSGIRRMELEEQLNDLQAEYASFMAGKRERIDTSAAPPRNDGERTGDADCHRARPFAPRNDGGVRASGEGMQNAGVLGVDLSVACGDSSPCEGEPLRGADCRANAAAPARNDGEKERELIPQAQNENWMWTKWLRKRMLEKE